MACQLKPGNINFTRGDGLVLILQDHTAGHKFGAKNNEGDQGLTSMFGQLMMLDTARLRAQKSTTHLGGKW